MNTPERVTMDPRVMGGRPVIRGTRVPVQSLVAALAAGDAMEQVCQAYRVTADDVRAALAYAADVLSDERTYALPGG